MPTARTAAAAFAVLLTFLGASCATTSAGDQPCESDDDCAVGQQCDAVELQCVPIQIDRDQPDTSGNPFADAGSNNGDPDIGQPDVAGDAANANNGTRDTATNNGTPDMGQPDMPATCTPACTAPATCVAGRCEYPDCAAAGQPCDSSRPDQGAFGCFEDGDGVATCVNKCADPYAASTCSAGEYCWKIGGLDVCVPSGCQTTSDCNNGTCLSFDNGFKACYGGGATPEGASCDPSGSECEPGTVCRPTATGGVCSAVCDPWGAPTGCPGGQFCSEIFLGWTGMCSSDVDLLGDAPFFECATVGDACDDAVQCFPVSSTVNGCLKYCRNGQSDCAGVTTGAGDPTICDNYVFGGVREFGICWPPCDPGDIDPCGAGAVCLNGSCRSTCVAGNEVSDCCGGRTPCDFSCDSQGLCE